MQCKNNYRYNYNFCHGRLPLFTQFSIIQKLPIIGIARTKVITDWSKYRGKNSERFSAWNRYSTHATHSCISRYGNALNHNNPLLESCPLFFVSDSLPVFRKIRMAYESQRTTGSETELDWTSMFGRACRGYTRKKDSFLSEECTYFGE